MGGVTSSMTEIFNRTEVKEKRRALRKEMPPAEKIIWNALRDKNLGMKFRRQFSIGPFIVDFYCSQLKLAIEIDGESHFAEGAEIRDRERQEFIESKGVHVLRFTNTDVYEKLEGVIAQIISRFPTTTSPGPSL